MVFFVIGVSMLASILGLFWLKDRLRSPQLARLANSEPVLRLAVVGAALVVIGLLMMAAALIEP
jgi:hypothetical protein